MIHSYFFRISVAFFFAYINLLLLNNETVIVQSFNFLSVASLVGFNSIMMFGLLLLPGRVSLKAFLGLVLIAISFAVALNYLVQIDLVQHATGGIKNFFIIQSELFNAQISLFISLCFYFSYLNTNGFQYKELFTQSWRVLLSTTLALIFVLLVWGLLLLASILFSLLGIDVVQGVIFSQQMRWVGSPVFFSVGISLLSEYETILDKIRQILLGFSKILYPLLVIIGLMYLIAIPFAQKPLENIWISIYFVALFNLFVFNGVYQAGLKESPYPRWLARVVCVFLVLIPFYMVYAMSEPFKELLFRKYDVINVYSIIMGLILFAYSLSYALACFVPRQDNRWMILVSSANKVMAIIVAVLFYLMATPVLDLSRWV